MIFFLIRIAPIILPLVYLGLLRELFIYPDSWPVYLTVAVLINLFYFAILFVRLRRQRVWLACIYSIIFLSIGIASFMLFSSQSIIIAFSIFWAACYAMYLESIFNYFYRTDKRSIFDLKNISAYLNLVLVFFLVADLLNFYVFLSLDWWWALLISIFVLAVILLDRFAFLGLPRKSNLVYSAVITLVLSELLGALFFWPSSIYVLSGIIAIFYYFFVSLATLNWEKKLTRKLFWQYFIFVIVFLLIILGTAKWL